MIDSLLQVIAPHECVNCASEGSVLCRVCAQRAVFAVPSRCFRCLKLTKGYRVCASCAHRYEFSSVWVAGRYEGALKLAIHSYKFLYKRAASEDLTTLLDSLLPPTRSDLIVVSVPTVTSRVRRRGFDHAMLLAKSLVHKRKLVYINVLSRTGQKQQVGLGRNDRLIAQKDTMYIRNGDIVVGKNILLVDDVVTTGSTLNEAARVLKSAGAARVDCVVLAQSALE